MEVSVLALLAYWWVLPILFAILFWKWALRLLGMVIVPDDSIGLVTKKFVLVGKFRELPAGRIIALRGEAGLQADTLAPGLKFGYWPWQYQIEIKRFLVVPNGQIAIVESCDGNPMAPGHILGREVKCDDFQDARAFLEQGGERGVQMAVIPPGTWRINTLVFTTELVDMAVIPAGKIGVVEAKDGRPLSGGRIIGRHVDCDSFQDAQAFMTKGGERGPQMTIIPQGQYRINPKLFNVTMEDVVDIPDNMVGIVTTKEGAEGVDVTGDAFKHGNLVSRGQKGVWVEPLDPGKYPINTYTHKVEIVPTANVVLNWATGKSEAHNLDKNLSTITVRSSDGFTFNLDVSQIIHIPRIEAPKVIARFGSMANLVTQVLEPTIGNYFRNAAQNSDVIDFLKQRSKRQDEAKDSISVALSEYNVGAVDTLIGDITPPAELMKTLTDRKLAEQEQITYGTQEEAEKVRKNLAQAKAMADTQPQVVTAERSVQIADFNAQAAIKQAEGQAGAKTRNAEADAMVLRTVGAAEGEKVKAVGEAEATVIKMKTDAMDQEKYAMVEVARALAASGFKLVPDIVAGGGGAGTEGGGSLVNVLLATLIRDGVKSTPRQEP